MKIADGCFHGLHIYLGKVRDAYNHGQGQGYHLFPCPVVAELRWASCWWLNVWLYKKGAPCGEYVRPEA